MNEELNKSVDAAVEDSGALLDAMRKVLLASVGAVVVAQESAEKSINKFIEDVEQFVARLVERGELAEKDARQLLGELAEKRKTVTQEAADKARERAQQAEQMLSKRVDEVVARLNVPTREDIDTLAHKLTNLGRKVDQLKTVQEPPANGAAEMEAAAEKVAA